MTCGRAPLGAMSQCSGSRASWLMQCSKSTNGVSVGMPWSPPSELRRRSSLFAWSTLAARITIVFSCDRVLAPILLLARRSRRHPHRSRGRPHRSLRRSRRHPHRSRGRPHHSLRRSRRHPHPSRGRPHQSLRRSRRRRSFSVQSSSTRTMMAMRRRARVPHRCAMLTSPAVDHESNRALERAPVAPVAPRMMRTG